MWNSTWPADEQLECGSLRRLLSGGGSGSGSSPQTRNTPYPVVPRQSSRQTLCLGFDVFSSTSVVMKTALLLLGLSAALCAAQRHRITSRTEWNEAADRAKGGCSNLTLVLDNWKYAIMTQVKDLLLHDHNTVLPEYGRIQPLSDALGDLYQELQSLKERLAQLSLHFHTAEAFLDHVRLGGDPSGGSGGRVQGRRSRVVIRRVVKPVVPQN